MPIQTIYVCPNLEKRNAAGLMCEILTTLHKIGCRTLMDAEYAAQFENVLPLLTESDYDLLLTVGGDGTIIQNAKHALEKGKPLLGVNAGRLGYLAQVEQDELFLLERLPKGAYLTQSRALLELSVDGKKQGVALNEVVFSAPRTRLMDFEVYENGDYLGHYRADGLIIATPTGSTAYSLAAGGPLIMPGTDCFVMTPICPHSLYGRSVVFHGSSQIQVKCQRRFDSDKMDVSIDGKSVGKLQENNLLAVSTAGNKLGFITFPEKTFGNIMQRKLRIYE